jgi:hypothetical protein
MFLMNTKGFSGSIQTLPSKPYACTRGPLVFMSQLIQIDERKIVSMDEISEDGYWQSIDGEWVPTEKQLEAINNGAITHDNVIVNQSGRGSVPDTFTHQVEEISSESKTLELNKCAACGNHFEGSEARKCPTKKCNNPICLNCDPLETTMSKTKDAVVLVAQLATWQWVSSIANELGKRTKCSDCMRNSREEDREIMSIGVSLFIAFWGIFLIDLGIWLEIIIFPVILISTYLLSRKVLKELYYPVHPKFSNRMNDGEKLVVSRKERGTSNYEPPHAGAREYRGPDYGEEHSGRQVGGEYRGPDYGRD